LIKGRFLLIGQKRQLLINLLCKLFYVVPPVLPYQGWLGVQICLLHRTPHTAKGSQTLSLRVQHSLNFGERQIVSHFMNSLLTQVYL
jgi:hypothetical protein